ncbi:MAG: hypothetical protein INR73_17300 [Williamsia sp.]|nr:hypothetical protein [Williamsia sp.]
MSTQPLGSEKPEHLIIDLEEYFHKKECHPEADPGVIILYRVKIDDNYLDFKQRDWQVKGLLAHIGKDSKFFDLVQYMLVDGEVKPVHLDHEEIIDFGRLGIERFIVQPKPRTFFIDRQDFHTIHPFLTVRQILVNFAKVSPDNKTLAKKIPGSGFHEYKSLDEQVSLEDSPHFTLFDNCTTQVS